MCSDQPTRSLVIVEDDASLARRLRRSFERRGYQVAVTRGPKQLEQLLEQQRPDFAVVDLRLGTSSGLPCVEALRACNHEMRIVVVTGYPSIATAVEATKLGAIHYLAKPTNADEIETAFARVKGDATVPVSDQPRSLKAWEGERIAETLAATGFNISETARRLDMHRRTLARKLKRLFPN